MLVAVQDDIYSGCIEPVPHRGDVEVAGVAHDVGREEAGTMPHCQGAQLRVRREVGLEPEILSRSREGGQRVNGEIIDIEHNDVPVAQIETVVPEVAWSYPITEVVERARRVSAGVLMVAQRGIRPRLIAPPTGFVT